MNGLLEIIFAVLDILWQAAWIVVYFFLGRHFAREPITRSTHSWMRAAWVNEAAHLLAVPFFCFVCYGVVANFEPLGGSREVLVGWIARGFAGMVGAVSYWVFPGAPRPAGSRDANHTTDRS